MKKLKRLFICIWILTIIYILPHSRINVFAVSEEFRYNWGNTNDWQVNTDFNGIIKEWMNDSENWLKRLLRLFMPNSDMYNWEDNPSFIFYLKTIVNLLLSFVSFIALILVIYAFYMIFFKKDEAGFTLARQIIKWVVIALFVIWLSRIVVSFLYRFENENTQNLWYKSNNTEIVTSLT